MGVYEAAREAERTLAGIARTRRPTREERLTALLAYRAAQLFERSRRGDR